MVNTCLVNAYDVLKPPCMAATVAYSNRMRRRPVVVVYTVWTTYTRPRLLIVRWGVRQPLNLFRQEVTEIGSRWNQFSGTYDYPITTFQVRGISAVILVGVLGSCNVMKSLMQTFPHCGAVHTGYRISLSRGCQVASTRRDASAAQQLRTRRCRAGSRTDTLLYLQQS